MASRRDSSSSSSTSSSLLGMGALLLVLLTALASAPCALSHTPLDTTPQQGQQGEVTADSDGGIMRSLLSSSEASEAAGLGVPHRSLAQRKRGGHPPGKGKHGPGKGGHPPGKGGHKKRKEAKQGADSFAAASTSDSKDNGPKVAQEKTYWCATPPANFSENLVNQINIRKLIDETPHLTELPKIGRMCRSVPAEFDNTTGSQNLCVHDKENGLWRSDPLHQFGVFSANIKCPNQANSSGLVTTFYTTSDFKVGDHDEIDYEFLNRYNTVLQINTWTRGKSVWFKNVMLDFDCAKDYHNYAFLWTPQVLIWYVDYKVVGFFPNTEAIGGPLYPTLPSHLVGSFWDGSGFDGNADKWAGRRDPSTMQTEFVAQYRDIKISKPIKNALCPFNYS